MSRRIVIEEEGAAQAPATAPPPAGEWDEQDVLLAGGILLWELAALAIWWPAALISGSLFCFIFVYMIERAKKNGTPKP